MERIMWTLTKRTRQFANSNFKFIFVICLQSKRNISAPNLRNKTSYTTKGWCVCYFPLATVKRKVNEPMAIHTTILQKQKNTRIFCQFVRNCCIFGLMENKLTAEWSKVIQYLLSQPLSRPAHPRARSAT